MVNIINKLKNKIQSVKTNVQVNLQKLKIFVIAMSTLQILTFVLVVVLLILYITG